MTTTFKLHPQLRADCHLLGSFELSLVLLNRNAALPWFILVPRTDATDLLDLDVGDRKLAIDESARVSAYVKSELAFPKVNFAAIGNVVPQLHLHIIGRKPGDTCWPSPVWGHLEDSVSYEANRRVSMATDLVQRYGMHGAEELA